jgi:Saxitoxin biosynthesis operon protein SxtJ
MALLRINTKPSGRQLAVFAAAGLAAAALAGWGLWRQGSPRAAATVWGVGLSLPLVGLVSRGILRAVFVGLSYATYPVGWIVSYVATAVVYFVAITPVGLIMRMLGHDPLSLRRRPESGWRPRPPRPKPGEYFNQG